MGLPVATRPIFYLPARVPDEHVVGTCKICRRLVMDDEGFGGNLKRESLYCERCARVSDEIRMEHA